MHTNQARRGSHRRSNSRLTRLLEPLEARTLLSAVIALSGNGMGIANGDTTPLLTDFTDFGAMSTTATAAIGTVTRTYQITNNGDADLNLTGSPNLVVISGANAGDFLLTADASASDIVPGATASFTISFVPLGTGLRQAEVTIASTDPSTPSMTFDIQGTGLATTNATNGLMIATTTAGTGSAAISGSDITVNYTGYLTTGQIFDTTDPTLNPGSTPFEFVLGRNDVIQGWEEGLLGIQAGETRALIIPASLAYGSSGSGSIPPNAPLIYTVSAVSVVQPAIAVSGNGTTIANGDTTPQALDFTDFGPMSTTVGTLGTVTRTYVISDSTTADLNLTGSPNLVSITGTDAGDFAVTVNPVTPIDAGSSSSFTISFIPQGTGLRQAEVTIASTDPSTPSMTFDIQGTGLATTNATNGLMIATTTAGSGLAAVTGSKVALTYTGTLFDGTVFSSATSSGAAFNLVLGDPSAVAGLNQGLIGIQPGETRTIIMPSTLGFGSNVNGSVPGDSPLIYTVTAQSVQAPAPILTVSGNGTPITNGATASSTTNFTDFGDMSTSVSAAIGQVTRTYVVSDTGGLNLILSGGVKAIQISGANKGDFSVVSVPDTNIASLAQSNFTLAFTPHGTGVRKAVITLISNDPNAHSFSFSIQGTGVNTNNSANGLEVATTINGAGTRAIAGASLVVNYTGTLLDGTIFDSSLNAGRTPLTFNLGNGSVIPGWDQGLLGVKAGQSLVLVIPAALAYGNAASGSIPPNSPLIFTIAVSSVTNPSIVVSGNGVAIADKANKPLSANGTAIATVAGSSSPVTVTFTVTSSNAGLTTFPKATEVTISPSSSLNFSASPVTTSGTASTFTITFTPIKVGTKSAVVHVHTADPVHPDFYFTVSGTYTSFVDLSAVSIGTIKYPFPGTVISGAATKYNVPVTVSNLGNISVPGNTPAVSFDFYLTDLSSGTQTLISSQTSKNLNGLGLGKSKVMNFNVPIPGTVPTGNYEMNVIINNNSASQDTNTSNDSAQSLQAVGVIQGYYDVDGVLSTSTLPATIAAGQPLTGKFSVLVENAGNLDLPSVQNFTLQVIARPVAGGADFILKTTTVSVGSLDPGQTASFTVSSFAAGLTAGEYQLLAQLTPVQALAESNTADNLASTNALGGSLTLTVT